MAKVDISQSCPIQHALSETSVPGITPYLTSETGVQGNPAVLDSNVGKSFQGSIVLGMGFVVEAEEAERRVAADSRNAEVLQPYLNGEDLNSRPDQTASRWVINFRDWPEEKARQFEHVWNIVDALVRPERQRKDGNGNFVLRSPLPERWWQFADKRPALYASIARLQHVIALTRVGPYVTPSRVPASQVISDRIVVVSDARASCLALLQSGMHECWARAFSSTLRRDLNYALSDCFETFPFPPSLDSLDEIGTQYDEHRRGLMQRLGLGLTKLYNRFHDPDDMKDEGIVKLRALHVAMDRAVCAAYGWSDLAKEGALGHGFHETKQGVRYTVSEDVRRELLARLLLLNWARHADELARGLVSADGKGKRSKSKAAASDASAKAAPAREAIERAVWTAVQRAKGPATSAAVAKQAGTTVEVVEACMRYAARCGWATGDTNGWSSNG